MTVKQQGKSTTATKTKSSSKSSSRSSSTKAKQSQSQPKPDAAPVPKGAPPKSVVENLPTPLNEVDDGKTDNTEQPNRNQIGEPGQRVGGDKSTERGRITVPPAPAQPHVIHNVTRRNDHDALTGHACEITAGEHKGKFGIFEKVDEYERDGFPKQVIVSLKNVTGFLLSLPYKHIRHVPHVAP